MPKWFEEKHKKDFQKGFQPIKYPSNYLCTCHLRRKVKKKLLWWKNKCSIHKCIMMIVRCFFAQQIFVFFYSIYFISLVLLFCFLVKKTSQKIQWCLLTLNFLGKYLVNKRVFKSCFAELIRPNHLFFQIGFFWRILLQVNLIFFLERNPIGKADSLV